jgi:hypothetical protein
MIRWIFLCVALFSASCANNRYFNATLNAVANAANASSNTALEQYCQAQLRAIGHAGQYENGHCESNLQASTQVTESQRAELNRVRTTWQPVVAAYSLLQTAHTQAVNIANGELSTQKFVQLLDGLLSAYRELSTLLQSVGVTLPKIENNI